MKVVLAQLNPTIGDFAAIGKRLAQALDAAHQGGAKLVIFAELATCGYPPRDLLEESGFVAANLQLLESLKQHMQHHTPGLTAIIGYVRPLQTKIGKRLANAAMVMRDGQLIAQVDKTLLPTYDVFDENRYFAAGEGSPCVVSIDGIHFGISICEDLWNVEAIEELPRYPIDVAKRLKAKGAQVLINLAASPFAAGKRMFRERLFSHVAREHNVSLLMVNQVGANDDLIFDGSSLAVDANGVMQGRGASFKEEMFWLNLTASGSTIALSAQNPPSNVVSPESADELLAALTLGIADYFSKAGFQKAVLGLSGGVDSALVAALAVRALGSERVVGIMMPSRFTSPQSLADARALASALKIRYEQISIEPLFSTYLQALQPVFDQQGASGWDTTEENLQARIRGALLMAYSNKFGHLLLTTGNKSELAVGYCTLYGDLTGGLAVISDLYKTQVYQLCEALNQFEVQRSGAPIISESVIKRAPSAELRENQTDQDSLPPYPLLDEILQLYIEEHLDAATIVKKLGEQKTVERVIQMVDGNEYKRRQMPLGLKVSKRAFGQGRRLPIVQRRTQPPNPSA